MSSSSPSTSTPSSITLPPPRLPLELHAIILSLCHPSTLAAASRVSLSFLELSGPLLYHSVTVKGIEGVETMFCSLNGHRRSEALSSHLALDQMKNLTIVLGASRSPDESDWSLGVVSQDRMPLRGALHLDQLVIELPSTGGHEFQGHRGVHFGLAPSFFEQLSPLQFTLRADLAATTPPIYHPLGPDLRWPDLRSVILDHACCWVSYLIEAAENSKAPEGVVLRYRVATSAMGLGLIMQYLVEDLDAGLLSCSSISNVIFATDNPVFKLALERFVRAFEFDFDTEPVNLEQERRAKIQFEVVGVQVPWSTAEEIEAQQNS